MTGWGSLGSYEQRGERKEKASEELGAGALEVWSKAALEAEVWLGECGMKRAAQPLAGMTSLNSLDQINYTDSSYSSPSFPCW